MLGLAAAALATTNITFTTYVPAVRSACLTDAAGSQQLMALHQRQPDTVDPPMARYHRPTPY